jgi:hypothetical protein
MVIERPNLSRGGHNAQIVYIAESVLKEPFDSSIYQKSHLAV